MTAHEWYITALMYKCISRPARKRISTLNTEQSIVLVRLVRVGDCWLLASVASLSMVKELFERVIPRDQEYGKVYIRFDSI